MGDIVNLDDMIRKGMGKYAGNGISKSSQQKDRPAKAMLDYARFLDAKAEYVENAACITEDAALKALNLAGIDPEGFYVDEESVDDYLDGVEDGEFFDNPIVYSCDKGDTYYYVEVYMNLTPDEDEKDLAVNSSIYKIDGCTTSIFDFESKSWDALPSAESPKKSFEVSGTEEDILNVLLCMTEGTLSKKKYDSIKRKHTSLFELYDQTCKYMEPAGFFDKSRKKIALVLLPKDSNRAGFSVHLDGKEFVLYQEIVPHDLSDDKKIYKKEVARTADIGKIKGCLYRMANRYTDDFVLTVPLSFSVAVDFDDPNDIGGTLLFKNGKERELTKEEKENLQAVKEYMEMVLSLL